MDEWLVLVIKDTTLVKVNVKESAGFEVKVHHGSAKDGWVSAYKYIDLGGTSGRGRKTWIEYVRNDMTGWIL